MTPYFEYVFSEEDKSKVMNLLASGTIPLGVYTQDKVDMAAATARAWLEGIARE